MKFPRQVTYLAILLTLIAGAEISQAKAKAKPRSDLQTTYTVVHAIPAGFGADIVDIYANQKLIVDNATPGTIKSFTIPRDRVEIEIYKNGETPTATSVPLLAAPPLYLTYGTNLSFVAHLTADEKPKMTVFKDTISEAGSKRSWLAIRHVAAVGAAQFRVNSTPSFIPFTNENQVAIDLFFREASIGHRGSLRKATWIVHAASLYLRSGRLAQLNYPAHTHCLPSSFANKHRLVAISQQVTIGVGWRYLDESI